MNETGWGFSDLATANTGEFSFRVSLGVITSEQLKQR